MSQKKASLSKLLPTICLTGLLFLFHSAHPSEISAADKPDLKGAFKKCRSFGASNGLGFIFASDNDNNIIISPDGFSLISLSSITGFENWKTQIGGRLSASSVWDEKRLFFLTSVEEKNNAKAQVLNSVSLATGIPNWQKKIENAASLKLFQVRHTDLLLYSVGEGEIHAARKEDGSVLWKKKFPQPIRAFNLRNDARIGVYTEGKALLLNVLTGEAVKEFRFPKNSGNNFHINEISSEDFLLLGYPSGELFKILPSSSRSEVIWKIKAGGGITGLFEVKEDVLVTSLDNFLYLISAESGKIKWKKRVSGRINIKPLIYGNYAVVVSSGDNISTVIDLNDGKAVNQIQIEEDNYFSGPPLVTDRFLVFQTFKGTYFFVNSSTDCK